MSGYNILGMPLIVTPVIGPKPFQGNSKEIDSRRNLYVLGLPFDLSKAEFANMFSRYGTVTHTVILATVDNASRRRGFVVMSTHEEAKRVISSMSRTQIKGHTIDISWAVVQRSQGFLDGEDRSMMLASPLSTTLSDVDACFGSSPALPTNEGDKCSNTTFVPTARLLVTHLPFLLFSQQSDLHPLFCPFGEIKTMRLLDRSLSEQQANTVSAVVEYAMVSNAREAKETLQTQSYTDLPVDVRYMQDTFSAIGNAHAPLHPGHLRIENKTSTFGLNPFATPFVLNGCSSSAAAVPFFTNQDNQTRSTHQMDKFISSGLPGDTHNVFAFASPYLTSNLAYHLSQANTISRSSSATSSRQALY
ncbi:hypothetical protein SERLA73DRAFT_69545 [Serpula lacrymans var. lacrymans S7.3]|uniref:RRM domain-containing protein n=2 Tax=Serpula lacrymans var. lacrymans TaxID=341189 RepID=F8PIS0_SERL3|nr:uncharacterized protein SERLADRAFT_433546 [Serpula lacrymans var. lacrymans S7.9]EGO03703.1 hypothetical protein SERLA73DRAFT_69545 [Serpula lacrymans var. lacrymans S7.3]EGO29568.1 hypothetical protein SERLADRAFT_433546 [Serpula lacrymans var. lacrymans S7.9]